MTEVLSRPLSSLSRPGSHSTIHKLQTLDYVPWQRSKQKVKSSTVLPALHTGSRKKSKAKTSFRDQPGYSKPTMLMTSQVRNPRELRRGKLDSGKTKFRLMRTMLRNRRTSLQELREQEDLLIKLNQELIKTIQDMEESSALKTRGMLQQQDIFGTIINSLGCSNKKKLQQMACELQQWKEKEESKMSSLRELTSAQNPSIGQGELCLLDFLGGVLEGGSCLLFLLTSPDLKQQVEQLNAKIKKTQEEVNFLSTYMDHEYPVKSVQIANLALQLQQVKDNQQDELDDFNEIHKIALESLSDRIQMKRKKLLGSLVAKIQQPSQGVLLQKTWENQSMVKYTEKFREVHTRHGCHPQHPCGRAATLIDGRAMATLPSLLSFPHLEP
ncbi:PREDICTED: uncharacterized protein C20orf96 homolog isoform X2 [Miniopterus natalensis]|uniref:uncharacterized protein C20orf96 homolog isoform X2 n=1 Tax=Miniopterus natalensis TaxID=291302 RepID=UPI0007A6FDD4|nr:PREDICTED: uncharacterized protein C20orf96 homolog isoform X2 [Miniopterus natalensis]